MVKKIFIVEEWDMEGGFAKKAFIDKGKAEKFAEQCKQESVKMFKKNNKCTWSFAKTESNDYHIRELELDSEAKEETFIDDFGTVWTQPTAESYSIVCKQVEYLKQDLAISEDFGKEQTAEVKKIVEENSELKKVVDATFLYMKHINSPLCLGWDNLIDAMQGWRNYIDERGKNNESK